MLTPAYYNSLMVTLTVRISESLAADIEAESRRRRMSKSDVVRQRLERADATELDDPLASIRDLIGSVKDDLPEDLSARTKHYLREWGFGKNRAR
jgi:hypothetical protein